MNKLWIMAVDPTVKTVGDSIKALVIDTLKYLGVGICGVAAVIMLVMCVVSGIGFFKASDQEGAKMNAFMKSFMFLVGAGIFGLLAGLLFT